jgi:hypothetical protein
MSLVHHVRRDLRTMGMRADRGRERESEREQRDGREGGGRGRGDDWGQQDPRGWPDQSKDSGLCHVLNPSSPSPHPGSPSPSPFSSAFSPPQSAHAPNPTIPFPNMRRLESSGAWIEEPVNWNFEGTRAWRQQQYEAELEAYRPCRDYEGGWMEHRRRS